jgi:single-strand DNA-binding protein
LGHTRLSSRRHVARIWKIAFAARRKYTPPSLRSDASTTLNDAPLLKLTSNSSVSSLAFQQISKFYQIWEEKKLSFSKTILVGHLGRDPELRNAPSGAPVCNFNVAVNEGSREKSGGSQKTSWYRVTVYGKQGVACAKYLKQGSLVYVEGRLRPREWKDKDGALRYSLGLLATDVQFLSSLKVSNQPAPKNEIEERSEYDDSDPYFGIDTGIRPDTDPAIFPPPGMIYIHTEDKTYTYGRDEYGEYGSSGVSAQEYEGWSDDEMRELLIPEAFEKWKRNRDAWLKRTSSGGKS